MKQYLDLLQHIVDNGVSKDDRTGTGTTSVFGYQMRFDLQKGFPLLTTKYVNFKAVAHELLWFISGSTNVRYLNDNGVHIWDEWADEDGDLGPIYGNQWRNQWTNPQHAGDGIDAIDQLEQAIELIRDNPDSRRIIVDSWNPSDLPFMRLAPCHCLFQFYVSEGKLSCQLYQRSADVFLGVPFNIASYALLIHMIAKITKLKVGEFIWTGGDCHIYNNHIEQVTEQMSRTPGVLPELDVNPLIKYIDDFRYENIYLCNYNPQPAIKAPIAV